jgi:hypothetical protein
MQLTAKGFVVRAARFLIAKLGALQHGAGPLQVAPPVFRVKR